MSAPVKIHFVNWPVVQAMVGNDIPYSELPTDHRLYYQETGAHLPSVCMQPYKLVTAGVIRFIERHRSMKKEAEFKVIVERLASQQQESNTRYDQLVVQYEQLLASYNAMKRAYESETEITKALKKQLDDILGMMDGAA